MTRNHVVLIFTIFSLGAEAFAKAPAWFTAFDQKRHGNVIEVSCSGRGPDKSLATQASLNECHGVGVQYVQGYEVKTKSISVETTKDASWHSESSSDVLVKGLECEPQKQECAEENESWTCYHLCKFNLAKAKLTPPEKTDSSKSVVEPDSVVVNRETTESPKSKKASGPSFTHAGTRTLILNTVPTCDDILIVGNLSRTVKCSNMPMTLTVNDGDREAIARLSGYKPKHIQFSTRKPGSESRPEEVTVYFDK